MKYQHAGRIQHLASQNPSEDELAMLTAFSRWYASYLPSALGDINMVEAFKAGSRYGRQAVPVPQDLSPG